MLQLQVIRQNPQEVIEALNKKHYAPAEEQIGKLLNLDAQRRAAQQELDALLQEINKASKEIGKLFAQGKKAEADALKEQTAQHKEKNKELSARVAEYDKEMQTILYSIPNTPHATVPEGRDSSENVIERQVGELDHLPQDALPHWELASKYDIIDFELGNKITGAGFPVYKGKGARLQRALINFFLDRATAAGYLEIEPPLMINEASGYGTGQLPDKDAQMYQIGLDNFYMIPTAFTASHQPWTEISVMVPRGQLSLSPEEEKEADYPVHRSHSCCPGLGQGQQGIWLMEGKPEQEGRRQSEKKICLCSS